MTFYHKPLQTQYPSSCSTWTAHYFWIRLIKQYPSIIWLSLLKRPKISGYQQNMGFVCKLLVLILKAAKGILLEWTALMLQGLCLLLFWKQYLPFHQRIHCIMNQCYSLTVRTSTMESRSQQGCRRFSLVGW
jgi:hypothetical protein